MKYCEYFNCDCEDVTQEMQEEYQINCNECESCEWEEEL